MENILLVDKPKGITSFDVIRILQKKLHANSAPPHSPPAGGSHSGNAKAPTRIKMGHAGTLDPLATGLMVIGVGEGTKKLNEYLKLPKEYEVEILLGIRTDTGDFEGKILESVPILDRYSEIEKRAPMVIQGVQGKIALPVPIYSAVKRGGKPLYKAARRGEVVEPPIKDMEVLASVFHGIRREGEHAIISCAFEVSSGTYIRSLAEELGRRLGCPATVKELRRTKIGAFSVEKAMPIYE